MADLPLAIELSWHDSGAAAGSKKISDSLDTVDKKATGAGKGLGGLITGLGSIGLAASGVMALAGGVAAVASGMVSGNAEMETYETQLGTLMGGADKAKERLAELARFGATTPFELPEVVRAEKVLLGFGLTGQKALDMTGKSGEELRTIIGDIAAGTGASFEEIALNFGKFSAGATGEAISRFQEMGIVTREQLAEMGIQFSKSGELISPLPEAMEAAVKIAQGKFGGGMDQLSKTFSGQMSTLADNFNQAKMVIMQPIFDVLKESVGGLNVALSSDGFQSVLREVSGVLAGAVKTAVEIAVEAFRLFQTDVLPLLTELWGMAQTLADGWGQSTSEMATGWGELWTMLQPLLAVFMEHVQKIYDDVLPELLETFRFVGGVISTEWRKWWSENSETITLAMNVIATVFGVGLDLLRGALVAVMRIIRGDWQGAWDAITEALGSAWGRVESLTRDGLEGLKAVFRNAGGALLGLLRQGLDAAWGGVIDNVRQGVARIASLLPHSYADEGPLSEPISWGDVLTGDFPTALDEFLESVRTGAAEVVTEFQGMTRGLQTERLQIEDDLRGMTEMFMQSALAARERANQIDIAATTAVAAAARIAVANAGAVPQRRDYLTPAEAMKGDTTPPGEALDDWGRNTAGTIVDWGRYNFKQNEEAAHKAHSFDVGGWVPGPIGAPLPATVHGGEYVLKPGEGLIDYGALAGAVVAALHGSPLIVRIPGIEDAVVYADTRGRARGRLGV